jgi:hypothetical protein
MNTEDMIDSAIFAQILPADVERMLIIEVETAIARLQAIKADLEQRATA